MSKSKQTKARSPLRRILKAVLRTACVLVFLLVFAAIAALLTVDRWVVPFAAWIADVEVVGEPGVIVFLANREVFLSGLKVKCPAGVIEAKTCGVRVDGAELSGRTLKEIRVSNVHAEGVRASLDFAGLAEMRNERGTGTGRRLRDG